MKPIAFLTILLIATRPASAATGVVESTGQFLVNSSEVYLSPTPGSTGNASLNGYDFGSFDPLTDTLELSNWFVENYAYNAGSGSDNWINNTNTATIVLNVGLAQDDLILGYASGSGNNHLWNRSGQEPVDLLAGLSNGTYTVTVSLQYTYNDWNGSATSVLTSTGNSQATASFTVVPEPAIGVLGTIGFLVLLRRRR